MSADQRLVDPRFPRASRYHPEWLLSCASGGANSLWLAEWLAEKLELRPAMRLLDLGCGRAASSIFWHREFGLEVWATDLWFPAGENLQRIRDAGVDRAVFPLHADARSLPFAPEFFDLVVCLDSSMYFATDELYLNYLAQFVKPDGQIALAGAGLMQEIPGQVPEHLRPLWSPDLWSLHSAAWWHRHWEKTGIVRIECADSLPDGYQCWLQWQQVVAPNNSTELAAVAADQGRYLGYVRCVGRRNAQARLESYCWPDTLRALPAQYTRQPLLRS